MVVMVGVRGCVTFVAVFDCRCGESGERCRARVGSATRFGVSRTEIKS